MGEAFGDTVYVAGGTTVILTAIAVIWSKVFMRGLTWLREFRKEGQEARDEAIRAREEAESAKQEATSANQKVAEQETRLAVVEERTRQLTPNGGKHMVDAVNRMEQIVNRIAQEK